MAKIIENTIVIRVSTLVKEGDNTEFGLAAPTKAMLESMVGEILAIPGAVIEADVIS